MLIYFAVHEELVVEIRIIRLKFVFSILQASYIDLSKRQLKILKFIYEFFEPINLL
jgi:hypothetical protein